MSRRRGRRESLFFPRKNNTLPDMDEKVFGNVVFIERSMTPVTIVGSGGKRKNIA